MKRETLWTMCFVAMLSISVAALAPATDSGNPRNPSLFEKRFQSTQLVASFSVDPDIAREWTPPAFELVIDAAGKATGVITVLYGPGYAFYTTPNSPPLEQGENLAPDFVVHFWFLIQGPFEVLPVPGAQVTSPTSYYYDVVDLMTNPVGHRLYLRAGRPAVFVSDITLDDQGQSQTVEITFRNGSKMAINAYTPVLLPQPLKLGGNSWQWHVGGEGKMGNDLGVRLDPSTGNPSNISITRGQFLALVPGPPNSTQVTIEADPGTIFEDCYGMSYVVASRATLLRPNNVVLNASRGDLLWTTYPSPPIPVPPALP